MKKIIIVFIVLILVVAFASCSSAPTVVATSAPSGPLSVTIDSPITLVEKPIVIKVVDSNSNPEFKYILVQETSKYYIHKIESFKSDNGIIIFKCSMCKNTIRIPEVDAVMYQKIGAKIAWGDYADICGGLPEEWYELLAEK